MNNSRTPKELGYFMPAEWETHTATWIGWPHNPEDWPGRFQPIPWVYADIVRHLSKDEDVHILVNNEASEKKARRLLQRVKASLARVHFHRWPTNRGWLRDSGPIFLKNRNQPLALTNWKFNAWAKYEDWQYDDQIPDQVAKHLGLTQWQPQWQGQRVVLEGGSIDTNGAGILLTTLECQLSDIQQRNPGLSRENLESVFQNYLGIEQVIWLNRGIVGDDTHGHVDDITRFVKPNTIITVTENRREDENYLLLAENLDILKSAKNLQGKPFEIIELPMPAPIIFDGQRLPASYANFYIANQRVLAPTFNDPQDRIALNKLAEVFPEREVTGIHCGDLIWGLGTLHCLSQQQPA
jgi:agmatine deiminase